MLQDSDSEPSESEPLVQKKEPPPVPKRDPRVWKSNTPKSSSDESSSPTAHVEILENRTDERREEKPCLPVSGSCSKSISVEQCSLGSGKVCIPGESQNSSHRGVTSHNTSSRGNSKRIHDIKTNLENVPENDEVITNCFQDEPSTSKEEYASDGKIQSRECNPDYGEMSSGLACPFFGVKNYLHQFYDKPSVKDPNLYEDDFPVIRNN